MAKDARNTVPDVRGLGQKLTRVAEQMQRGLGRRLAQFDVTCGEWAVLCELAKAERLMPSVLAEHLGMSRGGISRLIDRMVERGLVERADDNLDRRAHWLSISDRANDLMPRLLHTVEEDETSFFGKLDAREAKELSRLLGKLAVPPSS